ncbi:hypothetical protein COO58_10085 [Micromonospora sp. WMMA1996]|uniref:hypothetical protein n=1 Tax=Micromonospora sp. WMMA1996 TaxID=2039878 RepID=UPI000BF850BF|nr:hypothetical protein [Micromonospora sp. WMMA1996]PGH44736.1 hypothetical protein COO58_10085 [Micromonospora sp. WMMA1996]
MTRPEEPTEALPTRALPADPARDAQAAAPTVHLVPPRPPADADATAPLTVDQAGAAEPTVHLAGQGAGPPADADATVHLAGRGVTPPADADATVHLAGRGATPPADSDATVYLAGPGAARPGDADPTARLAGPRQPGRPDADGTVDLGGTGVAGAVRAEPTVHLAPPQQVTGPPTAAYRPGSTGPAAPTAGAYRDPTARAVSGVPAPASGGELRFGPGVPATPPPPPAWPVAPPIRPPRPLWRRVVSVLSTLLTAVLLVTVGLYLWQRLRPLEVEQVAVAVPRPPGIACDVTVDVVATVRTNGRAGTIRYQWFRSDAPPGALLSERVGSGQRTATLTLRWTFSGVGATTGTATVNIIEPAPVQAGTRVSYRCPGG